MRSFIITLMLLLFVVGIVMGQLPPKVDAIDTLYVKVVKSKDGFAIIFPDSIIMSYVQRDTTDTLVFAGIFEVGRIRGIGDYANYPLTNLYLESNAYIFGAKDSSIVHIFIGEDIGSYDYDVDRWTIIKIKEYLDDSVTVGATAYGEQFYYHITGTDSVKGTMVGKYIVTTTAGTDAYAGDIIGMKIIAGSSAGQVNEVVGLEVTVSGADTNVALKGVSGTGADDYALVLGDGSDTDKGHAFIEGAIKFEVHTPTAKDSAGGLYLDSALSVLTWVDGSNNFYTILLSDYSGGSFLDFPDSVKKWISKTDSSWLMISVDSIKVKSGSYIRLGSNLISQDTVLFSNYFRVETITLGVNAPGASDEVEGTIIQDFVSQHLMAYVDPGDVGNPHWIYLTDTTYAMKVWVDSLLTILKAISDSTQDAPRDTVFLQDNGVVGNLHFGQPDTSLVWDGGRGETNIMGGSEYVYDFPPFNSGFFDAVLVIPSDSHLVTVVINSDLSGGDNYSSSYHFRSGGDYGRQYINLLTKFVLPANFSSWHDSAIVVSYSAAGTDRGIVVYAWRTRILGATGQTYVDSTSWLTNQSSSNAQGDVIFTASDLNSQSWAANENILLLRFKVWVTGTDPAADRATIEHIRYQYNKK